MSITDYALNLQRELEDLRAENALLREERDEARWQLHEMEERALDNDEQIARLQMMVKRFSQVQGR